MKKLFTLVICSVLLSGIVKSQNQNSVAFDGVDDYVTAPGASSLIVGSSTISLTCWVYPTSANPQFPDFDGFAGLRNNLDADFYIMQYSPSTAVEARFTDQTGTVHNIAWNGLQLNVWQHFALTYDGVTLTLYYNGTSVATLPASGTIANAAENLWIGNLPYSGNNYHLAGRTDEISFWNKTLSAQEVDCIYHHTIDTASASLLLYYKCNQGIAGGNNTSQLSLTDVIGNINGTFNNLSLSGTTSNFVAGVPDITVVTDSICQGDSYTFGSQVLTSSGIYSQSFQLSPVCDSIIELHLTIKSVDTLVVQNGTTLAAHATGASYQWVDCNNNYAAIPGATSQLFTPTSIGSYAVIITQNGCSDTSNCHGQLTGVNETILQSQLSVFPNPSKNIFTINLRDEQKNISVSIKNNLGQEIQKINFAQSKQINIDASQWSKGIYVVTLSNQKENAHLKLIKQ